MTRRLLAVTGGHRFDEAAFAAMLDAVCDTLGWVWAHASQPQAQRWLCAEHAGVWDTILLHDLPGLELRRGAVPTPIDPSAAVIDGIRGLLAAGQGIVATHHALAGWPSWDAWADTLGGRFLYAPGSLHGAPLPASGYRMATYAVDVVATDHPVCRGIDRFELTDELYLCHIDDDVVPLLSTDADLAPAVMIDTFREVTDGVQVPVGVHLSGRPLLGWAHRTGPSPLVYLLPGHGPSTMEAAPYRRLLANAVSWVASDEARRWASAK